MSTHETIIEEATRVLSSPSKWRPYNQSLAPGYGFLEELIGAITHAYGYAVSAQRGLFSWNEVGTLEDWQQFAILVDSLIPFYEREQGWSEGIQCNDGVERWNRFKKDIDQLLNDHYSTSRVRV